MSQPGDQPAASVAAWEAAYLRFETPAEEIAKFTRRLKKLGADDWPRDAEIVELFCGRGNGLRALAQLGFTQLEGVDLSPRLLAEAPRGFPCREADSRRLPLAAASKDFVIIQDGLHHLAQLPDDLNRTLAEAARVLRAGGRIVIVEPWLTPFLKFVHAVCRVPLARRCWPKLDALAVMIEHERATYDQWLAQPRLILNVLDRHFTTEHCAARCGKLWFRGSKPIA